METKKEKPAKAVKKPEAKAKEYLVQKYALGPKADQEKAKPLFEKDNKRYMAVVVRTLRSAKEPVAFPALLAACVAEAQHGKDANVEANLRWYLNDGKKKGLIRSAEEKVEAKSKDEARGA